jgi:hypothetical protein
LKVCKDGRIWGQNNKGAGKHLGTIKRNIYVKKGHNPNSVGRPFPAGDKHPRWSGGAFLTVEEYNRMNFKQNGLCAICGKKETRTSRNNIICNLAVDHCHITNIIRGLLCHNCNVGLGHFKDRIDLLEKAIVYLKGE